MRQEGIAAIVGVGPRLGRSIARKFAHEGYTVAILSRDLGQLSRFADEIAREEKARVFAIRIDCSDSRSIKQAFEGVLSLGSVEVLVYNAYHAAPGRPVGSADIRLEHFEKSVAVASVGAFHCAQQVITGMLARGRGTILFTGCSASLTGIAGYTDLCCGKFATRGLAQCLARELQPLGIHVAHIIIHAQLESPSVGPRTWSPVYVIFPKLPYGASVTSAANNWTCTCSLAHQGNMNFVPANCSSFCDCSPDAGGSSENRWTCLCAAYGMPKLAAVENNGSCFTSCNCNSGDLTELQPLKKQISGKVVAIILLLCVIITAIALVGSVLWYFYMKDKGTVHWPLYTLDSTKSFSSASNLISQDSSSMPASKGCIPMTSTLFRRKIGALRGSIIQFSYSELESATNRFSDANLIGLGGSSHVYRGDLRDGRTVAIKRMKIQGGPDAEIELISRLHHCHVVPILGYCSEHQGKRAERLLVFEYIPNGNLRECLDGKSGQFLDWNTRVGIALGAARGLEYLHEAAAPRILHRDVKSTNILLDENWRAMITDLGMAKHLQKDGIISCSSSPARMHGTFGYFAPEYAIVGRASLKSDVFSFGVVLLELITGRKPIHKSSHKGEESLVIWATPHLHDHKRVISELPDPRLKGDFQEEEIQVMAYLAKECLLLDPDSRPSMSEVVQILSSIAPEKSKRKNLPVHFFQARLGSRNPEIYEDEIYDTLDGEEIKQITSEKPAIISLPSDPGIDFYCLKNENKTHHLSTDVEKLILLTLKSRSWRLQDDEVVDLTEPRLESFCLPSADSHTIKIP
ncbi:receptor-like serine/threonine-protein kinase NCRK [Dorcoceras hygrometricum]|uniref:non-specific serine/threonine protein kinase n=1 Tax=Dorcoceras hygrometricum TaxID=472368 RepID=A0A2Z7BZ55_9LAMI|nr:receptor-like serine/threonine-protein kinase NCRK [Dorcoceras hygrometricum]